MLIMKSFFLSFILVLCVSGFSQSFKKAWDPIQKRIDKGESFSNEELNKFLVRYEKDLDQNLIERSILFDFLGSNAFKEEKYDLAVDYFNKAIDITKSINDTIYRAFYNYDLACLYNHIGYYPDAENLFRSSLPILAAVYGQNSIQYTMRFKVLAEMYVEMGNYAYAKSMNDALLYYFKTLNGEKDREYLICLNNDARISQGTGDYAKALQTFQHLLGIHGSLNPIDTADYITTINNTAEAYRLTGNYKDALNLLQKAMDIHQRSSKKDELMLATIYNNLGLCYKATGNYNEAERSYDKSIAIYKRLKLDYSPDYTNSLNNQAELYRNLGRYKQAHDLLLNVIYIRKNSLGTQHQNYANALNNMALVHIDEGSYKEAEPFLVEANQIYKQLLGENHPFYANGLNSLAMLYAHLKRYKESEDLKAQAITIIKNSLGEEHERYAYFLGGTVTLYDILGKYDQAIENVGISNRIIKNKFGDKHIAYIDGIFNLAYFQWKKKNYKKAEQLFIEALNAYKVQFDKYFESMSEAEQLSYYDVLGNRFDSFDSFVISYTKLFPKEDHNELLATCFNYQLFIKSLLLNKSVNTRKNILASNDSSLINKYNRWISIKQQLAGSFRDLDFQGSYWNMAELEEEANRLEQYLKSKSLFSANVPKTYPDIQNKLKPTEAAITIIREDIKTNDTSSVVEYVALVLRKDKPFPSLVRISRNKEFETEYINDYINLIYDREEDAVSYNRFWKPIASQLTGINTVYLSTDGIYNQVNLYTLKDPVTHKYVLDQFNISILPNLSYIFNEEKSNASLIAELYGFPDYDYDFAKKANEVKSMPALALNRYGAAKLIPLPGTKTEVDNISDYLNKVKWTVKVYEKEKASEEQLKKVISPKVLHIATHGFFLKDIMDKTDKSIMGFESTKLKMNPLLRSGIMMAGASAVARDTTNSSIEQDGIFTAYEASLLNLSNTDLVVLSACETGLGVDLNNQGVYGLQRAFYIAGAKNLIMSLWQVDDDATMILMSEFYKEWSLDPTQAGINKAFKKAQREVRKKYPHPYYWGAFTLLGN